MTQIAIRRNPWVAFTLAVSLAALSFAVQSEAKNPDPSRCQANRNHGAPASAWTNPGFFDSLG
jgi:hypothetical protein